MDRSHGKRKAELYLKEWKKGRVLKSPRWELEKIVDHRLVDGDPLAEIDPPEIMVCVVAKWVGYEDEGYTIEPVINLLEGNSLHLVQQYFARLDLELCVDYQHDTNEEIEDEEENDGKKTRKKMVAYLKPSAEDRDSVVSDLDSGISESGSNY